MALGGLKKETELSASEVLINEAVADFIAGAKTHTTGRVKKKRKYERYVFSLTPAISQHIDALAVVATGHRVSRSDVIKAAVALLSRQDKALIRAEILKIVQPDE